MPVRAMPTLSAKPRKPGVILVSKLVFFSSSDRGDDNVVNHSNINTHAQMPSFIIIKMLGFTLTVAVFIDATIVRIVIGPALLQLAGDWNWWPLGLAGSKGVSESESIR